MKKHSPRTGFLHGFTLVELSIVLVILGLLIGGVLTGQSLIRAAELRSVTTQFNQYSTAFYTFRDKYFALPGDMNNATNYWGAADPTPATCRDTASTSTATCNGDGDGRISVYSSTDREQYRAWQHLTNAGLIEGQYNGINSPTSWTYGSTPGTNIPKSKISTAGYSILNVLDLSGGGTMYPNIFPPAASGHFLMLGLGTTNALTSVAALKNEDAYNIDAKIDDGKPGAGKVTTMNNTFSANCASSDVAASATYQLSNAANAVCTLNMALGL